MAADRQPLAAIRRLEVAHGRTAEVHHCEIGRKDQRLPELGRFVGALVVAPVGGGEHKLGGPADHHR
ncbi:MAG: hypothetical protein ACK559_16805, partial [bacterium]